MLKYPLKADKSDKDYTRAPSLNVKIPCWEGKWSSEVYDEEENCLFSANLEIGDAPIDYITKATHVIAVIQCGGIYVVSGKVGVTWKLIQAVVKQTNTSLVGRCLVKLPEPEKVKFVSTPAPPMKEEEGEEEDQEKEEPYSPKSTSSSLLNDEHTDDQVEDEADLVKPVTKPRRGGGKRA